MVFRELAGPTLPLDIENSPGTWVCSGPANPTSNIFDAILKIVRIVQTIIFCLLLQEFFQSLESEVILLLKY